MEEIKKIISKTIKAKNGNDIHIETGKLAKQADGSVVVRCGDAMLLATVVAEKDANSSVDFLPLSVDYQEKFSGGGRIPGGFLKREGKLSDREILISRLVDRAIRPLFPKDFHAQVQISINLISMDSNINPDALAALAASTALAVSDIPVMDYVSEVRIARIDGKFVINPTIEENKTSDIDIIVAGTQDHILMVEGQMNEVSEEEMIEAIYIGHEEIILHCKFQKELAEEIKINKREYQHAKLNPDLEEKVDKLAYDSIYAVIEQQIKDKKLRHNAINDIKIKCIDQIVEEAKENEDIDIDFITKSLNKVEKRASRDFMFKQKSRLDGRKMNQIRPIWTEVDYLPGSHGSSIFTRGETQSLTTITLGGKLDEQIIDNVMESGSSKFLLHYNFPGFSTGDIKPSRAPSRREIGHANLAKRALEKVLPEEKNNPYTIRVVSDILESNGSSSMATVCAASLALMDAGIKLKKSVSGIAMGLITDPDTGKYEILSDIIGDEDHLGDMDFKITGTRDGITACQMDIKVEGLKREILQEALDQAKDGRLHILNEMDKTLSESREDLKPNAPRIESLFVEGENIGTIIGPSGKTIQEIQKLTDTIITIENIDNKGLVKIYAPNKEKINLARDRIMHLTLKPKIGEVYTGKVKSITDFGVFVEFLPNKDGLLHISEVNWERISDLNELFKVGENISVKLLDIEPKTGRYKLSRKVLLPKPSVSA